MSGTVLSMIQGFGRNILVWLFYTGFRWSKTVLEHWFRLKPGQEGIGMKNSELF